MPAVFTLGEIYEQKLDANGRYQGLVATGRHLILDLLQFNVIHVRGAARSGKTSRFLRRKWYVQFRWPGAHVVIDLSPEPENLHHAMRAADAAGKTCVFLCLEPGVDTYHIDLLQMVAELDDEGLAQLAQLMTASFGIDRGSEPYFTWQACTGFIGAIQELKKLGVPVTPKSIADYLDSKEGRLKFPHAAEMAMPMRLLSMYPQLTPHPGRQICLRESMEKGYVIYIYISRQSAPLVFLMIVGPIISTIMHVAREMTNRGSKPSFFFDIDEHQTLAGLMQSMLFENLKYGARLTCSHQSTSQLKTNGSDLSHSIFETSTLKVYLTSFGDDAEAIQSRSMPTRLVKRRGVTRGRVGLNQSSNESEEYQPFISAEAILDASEREGMAIVTISDGTGHKEPVFVQLTHGDLERLDHLPLPMKPVTPPQPPVADPGPGRRIPLDDPVRQARHAAVRCVIERCVAEAQLRKADGA